MKIVVIGGGHGTSIVLASLSKTGHTLSGVLAMADDGGSTGRLRQQSGFSAVGDIRQCLVRLATKPELSEIFAHRFEGGKLDGHSLGNLFLVSGEAQSGNIEDSINIAREALGITAKIIPSTLSKPHLSLKLDEKNVKGVYQIAHTHFEGKTPELSLSPESSISESAKKAITEADLIVIAPGNFYCSIIPTLIVKGMSEAIEESKGKVLLVANLVNRRTQTAGFTPDKYIEEIQRLGGNLHIDAVLYNTAPIPAEGLREGEEQIVARSSADSYLLLGRDIADMEPARMENSDKINAIRSLVRHDQAKLAAAITEVLGKV